ncbi:ferredoxin [Nocardioides sp. NPDC057577]|uniref:ferredoxin n=1 Tax=unclassified Nocardioides TaxID=2615069 RepID=UPI0036553681
MAVRPDVRPDVRLDDAPMQPVTCGTCEGHVQVRKSSWDQTSIQWSEAALAACVERRASSPRPGPNGATFTGCAALRDAIREAAVRGDLTVIDDTPLKTNPAAHHDTEVNA